MADAPQNDDEISEIKRWYLEVFDDANNEDTFADRIRKMRDVNKCRLSVNLNDLRQRIDNDGPAHAKALVKEPVKELLAMQQALKDKVESFDPPYAKLFNGKFFVGIEGHFGANHVTPRGLSAKLLGQMVTVEGIVSRCTLVHPKVVKSVHYCPETEQSIERSYRDVTSLDGVPTGAVYPKEDDQGNKLVTEYGLSIYKNHQRVTIQEMPERAPTGQLPRSVEAILDDDLVDACKAGDRVQIVGIYRAMPSKQGGVTTGVFKTVLLANNVRSLEKDTKMPTLTDRDIHNINKFARSSKTGQHPFDVLAKSLAQTIYGNVEIKKGLLCLLLGGEEKILKRGGHLRGDINILMVGDPSCGKSQMLRFVQNIAQHCLTTTGRGSSGVGLTAAVTTDQDTGERSLEAGAMVLADRGVVCIDEFDKMSDIDRVAIHEVMEQQTVTISKAGIHTSLNARCSVLAAANPVYGRYDPYQTPMENIGLPDSLLSRFDLLFIMLDKMEPETDRNLADHVLRSHTYRRTGERDGVALDMDTSADVIIAEDLNNAEAQETPMYETQHQLRGKRRRNETKLLSLEFCKKYIMYCKAKCHPVLTAEAAGFIAERYATLRSKETDSKSLPVTARTLECMIRLSTAYAKARLSDEVEMEDAENALQLVNFAYYNEAEKRNRSEDFGDSDSDDNDDDTNPRNERTPGSARKRSSPAKSPRAPKDGARTPKSTEKSPVSTRTSMQEQSTTRKSNVRAAEDDRSPETSKKRSRSSESASKQAETEAVTVVDVSPEQHEIVKHAVKQVLETERSNGTGDGQTTTVQALVTELTRSHPNVLNASEIDGALEKMADENDIMRVDNQIILI